MALKGFQRLWLVATILIVLASTLSALSRPNIMGEGDPDWGCVPGSASTWKEQELIEEIPPTDEQVQAEIEKRSRIVPQSKYAEIFVRGDLTRKVYRDQVWHKCTSYFRLAGSILRGLLLALLPAIAFLVIRWIYRGFREPAS